MTTTVATPILRQTDADEKHPKGLYVLFATEMWERFGFYSMLAMFTLYLQNPVQGFGWTAAQATSLYSNYMMFVYASPLIGGWLADRVTGYRMAITIGGLLLAAGYILLAFHSVSIMYWALALIVAGNGFFKPNVSTMVGNLYPDGSGLKDSAYNFFYMGINVGAFIAPVAAETVMQRYSYHRAFSMAGAGMLVSLIVFWGLRRFVVGRDKGTIKDAGKDQVSLEGHACGGAAPTGMKMTDSPFEGGAGGCLPGDSGRPQQPQGPLPLSGEDFERRPNARSLDAVSDAKRVTALIVIFLIVIVFWMIFHQNFSTLTYWANDNTSWTSAPIILELAHFLTLGTIKPDIGNISGVISNAIDPFWIVVLTFPLVGFWRWLGRKGREPSTPAKMAGGMFLTACAFYLMYLAAHSGGDAGKVSPWWLISAYGVIALGELMLSPMGLSLVSKVAPTRMRGLMMGGWFVATAIGSKLTAIGVYWQVWKHSTFFFVLATMALITGLVLVVLLKPLKKAMPGA